MNYKYNIDSYLQKLFQHFIKTDFMILPQNVET